MKYQGRITDPKDLVTKEYVDSSAKTEVAVQTTEPTDPNTLIWVDPNAQGSSIDSTPTQGSLNAVQSGGVYTALEGKVDKETGKGLSANDFTNTYKGLVDTALQSVPDLDASKITSGTFDDARIASAATWNAKQNALTFDLTPTASSTNPVTSQGIKSYVDTKDGRRTRTNITSNLANLSTAISEQNLEKYGYAIGDYFVGASGYYYHLADMDTYYGGYNYNAVVSRHHCAIVVDTKSSSQWYTTTTAPRYDASTLHTFLTDTALNNIKSDLIALFGGSTGLEHLVSHDMLANGIGTWGWSGANYIRAMSEVEVYGSRVWSGDNYQQGEAVKKLTIFDKFRFNEIIGNTWFWLRSLSSSSDACHASSSGIAYYDSLAVSVRVVGLILFY